MPSMNHVHKYRKGKLGKGSIIYKCMLPDCTHYLTEEHIVGKKTICWVCEKVTIIYRNNNGILAKPHCRGCTKSKSKGRNYDLPPLSIPNIFPG